MVPSKSTSGVTWSFAALLMVIGAVPVIVVFLLTQRYYIAGITTTGIKG